MPDSEKRGRARQEVFLQRRNICRSVSAQYILQDMVDRKSDYDIASMNGIPTESTALLEKCLRENDAAEAAYQASIIPPKPPTGGSIDPQPPKPPVHKPPKTVTMRMLTHNKTYRIKTKDDVEKFLDEMRKSLLEQLDYDTTINLS